LFRKPTAAVGDRFEKTGVFSTGVWVVEKIFEMTSEPPHARLLRENGMRDSLTISVATLCDPAFFTKLP